MRILLCTDLYWPTVNGVVTSVMNLTRGLRARGHEVRTVTLSSSLHAHEDNNVTYLSSINADKIYPGVRVLAPGLDAPYTADLVEWAPDIIHTQCEFSTFQVARRVADQTGAPMIHTYHTVYQDYAHYWHGNSSVGRRAIALFSRWVVDRCACTIAPTQKIRDLLEGYGATQPIEVIPTGIDLTRFVQETPAEVLEGLRAQLRIPPGARVQVFVGRLGAEKNVAELLRFFAGAQDPDAVLLLVGDGPDRGALEQLAQDLGIAGRVRFAGMVDPNQVADYYHLADLFTSASTSETQGLTYVEALAAGVPTLCRQDPCLDGLVVDGVNGWQYENGQQFYAHRDRYFSDPGVRERMRHQAAQSVERFSIDHFAQSIEQVYLQAVGNASRVMS